MGRPGAFLEHGRRDHGELPASQAVRDFAEMARPLAADEQRVQASRCMYCGVAFCQVGAPFAAAGERPGHASGCPLHNLIPEWNDLLCRGRMADAAARMALTNPFPEFTGRVCPAPCEAACNLGLHEAPTTIRDDERAISDWLWDEAGGPAPLPAPAEGAPLVGVIGSGPAGLAAAWELARRGLRVRVVERDDRAGGLLTYGIPAMKLPKDVVARRLALMEASGIRIECGVDAADPEVAHDLLATCDAVVVATGARAARPLDVPGSDAAGVHPAMDYLTAATRAVLAGTPEEPAAPAIDAAGLDVVVLGGGDTGTDCVATALRQGARSVRQVIRRPSAGTERPADNPWPEWPEVRVDGYGQREAAAVFGEDPRVFATDTLEVVADDATSRVTGLRVCAMDWSGGRGRDVAGTERVLPAQLVLVARGFSGPEPGAFAALDVDMAAARRAGKALAVVDDAATPVYVAGDARIGASLVVNAIAEGLACAARVARELAR